MAKKTDEEATLLASGMMEEYRKLNQDIGGLKTSVEKLQKEVEEPPWYKNIAVSGFILPIAVALVVSLFFTYHPSPVMIWVAQDSISFCPQTLRYSSYSYPTYTTDFEIHVRNSGDKTGEAMVNVASSGLLFNRQLDRNFSNQRSLAWSIVPLEEGDFKFRSKPDEKMFTYPEDIHGNGWKIVNSSIVTVNLTLSYYDSGLFLGVLQRYISGTYMCTYNATIPSQNQLQLELLNQTFLG